MTLYTKDPPVTDVIRPIAKSICAPLYGREYDQLETNRDAQTIEDLFRKANLIRYMRNGVDPTLWSSKDELAPLLKFV